MREALVECPTCGTGFRPGRPGGVVRRYCRRLCNPRYGWSCTICGTVRDAGGRGRAQTPDDKYICHPCRRERNEALVVSVRDDCLLCHGPLSQSQQASGNKFCSPACAYRLQCLVNDNQPLPPHKRIRRFGGLRPADEETGAILHGPCRRQKLSIHLYEDGALTIGCPWCAGHLPIQNGQDSAWCGKCAALVFLDKQLEVSDAA